MTGDKDRKFSKSGQASSSEVRARGRGNPRGNPPGGDEPSADPGPRNPDRDVSIAAVSALLGHPAKELPDRRPSIPSAGWEVRATRDRLTDALAFRFDRWQPVVPPIADELLCRELFDVACDPARTPKWKAIALLYHESLIELVVRP